MVPKSVTKKMCSWLLCESLVDGTDPPDLSSSFDEIRSNFLEIHFGSSTGASILMKVQLTRRSKHLNGIARNDWWTDWNGCSIPAPLTAGNDIEKRFFLVAQKLMNYATYFWGGKMSSCCMAAWTASLPVRKITEFSRPIRKWKKIFHS